MSRRAAGVLLAAAAWTLLVWCTRIANILGDAGRSAGFKAVHAVLALVSVAFALAVGAIGIRAWRAPARRAAGGRRRYETVASRNRR